MKTLALLAALFTGPNPAEYDAFSEVYQHLSTRFVYVADMTQFGRIDVISPEVSGDEDSIKGDCEEYMFAANYQLAKRGVWSEPLFIPGHVMNCGEIWCIDTLHRGPFLKPPEAKPRLYSLPMPQPVPVATP